MFKIKNRWMKKEKNSEQEEEMRENLSQEEKEELREEEPLEDILEEQVEAAEEEEIEEDEAETLRNKYLRLVAEFDNYRKRTAKERVELMQTAEKGVVQALLDVLDDADRAEIEMGKTEDAEVVREGASLIFNKLRKILEGRGLSEMDSLHKAYDAELQEAIAEIPAPSEDLKGKVIDNVQKGYYLNDKIIRHAKVVVGK